MMLAPVKGLIFSPSQNRQYRYFTRSSERKPLITMGGFLSLSAYVIAEYLSIETHLILDYC